jgi:hypothetical protein
MSGLWGKEQKKKNMLGQFIVFHSSLFAPLEKKY